MARPTQSPAAHASARVLEFPTDPASRPIIRHRPRGITPPVARGEAPFAERVRATVFEEPYCDANGWLLFTAVNEHGARIETRAAAPGDVERVVAALQALLAVGADPSIADEINADCVMEMSGMLDAAGRQVFVATDECGRELARCAAPADEHEWAIKVLYQALEERRLSRARPSRKKR